MKKLFLLPLAVIAFGFQSNNTIAPIEIGTMMPKSDVKMLDVVSGKEVSLADSKGEKGTLVIFSCNTCPYVIAQETRILNAQKKAKELGIGVVVINSNEAKRGDDDSQKAMKAYAKKQSYTAPYVMDKNSEMADAFGATRTPETFLFDKDGKLVYRGSIDDSPKDQGAAKTHYLREAMTALSEGKEIATKTTVSSGCSIKRKAAEAK
jgi:peroxiredoxin